jgi:hypothetical protein
MKLAFISLFSILFVAGAILKPISFNTLSATTIGLLVVTSVLDRIGMWFARKSRVGMETERVGTVESVTFLNNPWAKNWVSFRFYMYIVLTCQIFAMASLTLWLGELIRHIFAWSPS